MMAFHSIAELVEWLRGHPPQARTYTNAQIAEMVEAAVKATGIPA